MELILFSLVQSLVFLALVGALGWHRRVSTACWISLGATVLSLSCVFSPAFGIQALLTTAFGLVCLSCGASPRVMAWGARGAMLVSYTFFLGSGLREAQQVTQLRQRYPLESLADRLEYEALRSRASSAEAHATDSATEPPLGPQVAVRLATAENSFEGYSRREQMLHSMHYHTVDRFVMARGFGPIRMVRIRVDQFDDPPSLPIPLPAERNPEESTPHDSAATETEIKAIEGRGLTGSESLAFHDAAVADFLDAERMGYVQSRNAVAGFQSHQFSAVPSANPENAKAQPEWRIARVDLISLLKHAEPVAYVSENLPRMEELRDAPTRALNEFERTALEKLRADEDVVTDDSPERDLDRVRMLGSLRAAKSCLRCHSVDRGKLLGAFSYELVPANSRPKRTPAASQQRTS